MNIPALFIVLMLSLLLIRGMKESAFVNGLIVITKVAIVILIIVLGWGFINPANHTPYIPPAVELKDAQGVLHTYGGFWGIIGAAGVVFFAYIGFDAVSTAAQETDQSQARHADRHPRLARDLHRAVHPVRARPDRHRAGRRLPQRRARGLGRLRDHRPHARVRAGWPSW